MNNLMTSQCFDIAVAFLTSMNMYVASPQVTIMDAIDRPAFYLEGTVYIRTANRHECKLWVHEFVHHQQELKNYPNGYWAREAEAHRYETLFLQNQ